MNNEYLIPANSKKSMLYLNLFNKVDLIIFGSGIAATLILILLNIGTTSLRDIIIILLPVLVCSFLVIPLPNVHNVRTFIKNVYLFYTNPRTYYWKGWSLEYVKDDAKKL